MQVLLLVGRMKGQTVEMPFDRAQANAELGLVKFVNESDAPVRAPRAGPPAPEPQTHGNPADLIPKEPVQQSPAPAGRGRGGKGRR